MSIQENINTIFLKNKSDYCFVVIHKWKERASDEMIKMEKEEKEEEEESFIKSSPYSWTVTTKTKNKKALYCEILNSKVEMIVKNAYRAFF